MTDPITKKLAAALRIQPENTIEMCRRKTWHRKSDKWQAKEPGRDEYGGHTIYTCSYSGKPTWHEPLCAWLRKKNMDKFKDGPIRKGFISIEKAMASLRRISP